MDPKETLMLLSRLVTTSRYKEALDTLRDYRDWRAKGGFEPKLAGVPGDEVAKGYEARIAEHMARW